MIERVWLNACRDQARYSVINKYLVDDRRKRLFACVCMQQVFPLYEIARHHKAAVVLAERVADGYIRSDNEFPYYNVLLDDAARAAEASSFTAAIIANFYEPSMEDNTPFIDGISRRQVIQQGKVMARMSGIDLTWDKRYNTKTVVDLAEAYYHGADNKLILADALEDAGAPNQITSRVRTNDFLKGDWIIDRSRGL